MCLYIFIFIVDVQFSSNLRFHSFFIYDVVALHSVTCYVMSNLHELHFMDESKYNIFLSGK